MNRDMKYFVVITLFSLLGIMPSPLHAQSAGELSKQIQDNFGSGNFEEAAQAAEKYIAEYPNLPDLIAAIYVSGVANFAKSPQPNYDLAVKRLQETYNGKLDNAAENPPEHPNPSLKEFALYYMALAYAGKADTQNNDQTLRKKTLQQSINTFDKIIKEFPKSEAKDDIILARAKVFVQMDAFDKAQADLENLRTSAADKSLVNEISSMLAWVYRQISAKKAAEFKDAEVKEYNQKAREIYTQISKGENLAAANDAKYQLAMLDFADKNTEQALKSFRALRSKTAIIQDINKRIDDYRTELTQAVNSKASDETLKRLKRSIEKEQQKLEIVKKNPDMAIEAMIMIANTFLLDAKYDEARTYFNYVLQFADEEQNKRIRTQKIISKAMQGLAKEADADFAAFRQEFPKDPGAQSIDYLIGMQLLAQSKLPNGTVDEKKVQTALGKFEANLKNFPDAAINVEIPKAQATAYLLLKQPEKATESYKKFLDDAKSGKIRVPPAAIEDAQRLFAISLASSNKYADAINVMKNLSETASSVAIRRDAHYKTAEFLETDRKIPEAIATFKSYAEKYPDTEAAPIAILRIAQLTEKAQGPEAAIQIYRDFISKYPNDVRTPMAYDKIWRIYLSMKKTNEMLQAQEDLLSKFPQDSRCISAFYERGRYYNSLKGANKEESEANENKAIEAFLKSSELYDKIPKENLQEGFATTAGYSLIRIAEIYKARAKAFNPKINKDDAEKKEKWKGLLQQAIQYNLQAVLRVPGTEYSANVLNSTADMYVELVNENVIKMDEAMQGFAKLATQVASNPSARLQILIAQSAIPDKLGFKDQARKFILEVMKDAPADTNLYWADADRYGNALLEDKQYDKARDFFTKLNDKYRNDKNEYAKSCFLYGLGMSYFYAGKIADAQKYFDELRKLYPRSPKVPETFLRQGDVAKNEGKSDEALDNYKLVMENTATPIELRAESSYKFADLLEQIGDAYNGKHIKNANGQPILDPKTKATLGASDFAINNFIRVALYFGDADPKLAADSLLRAAKLLKKKGRNDEARTHINRIIKDYASSPVAVEAREFLNTIPASKPQ